MHEGANDFFLCGGEAEILKVNDFFRDGEEVILKEKDCGDDDEVEISMEKGFVLCDDDEEAI